jgi:thiamine-phosphate pyrophosphorylase
MAGACRLYLITPPVIELDRFRESLGIALDAGDVAALQLRLKDSDDDTVRRAADALRPICQARGVALIMNDRPDLAVATGCDGVHVGQSDTPADEARKIIGPDRQLGVTCHASRDLAMAAGEAGADYVAFGAPLVAAGADFLAVVSAVWNHPHGPGAGVKDMNAAIAHSPPRD